MAVIQSVVDLNSLFHERFLATKKIEELVERTEQILKDAKSEHAKAMMELCKVSIYKDIAKRDNEHKFFEWIESNAERWENSGKRYQNSFWDFQTPTMKFQIKIKERHDLKVWKYEVFVSATKVYFESFEGVRMYDRNRRNGWSMGWTNFLVNHYKEDTLQQKFKTFDSALQHVEKWKKELITKFSFEINYDRHMYLQATEKYKNESIYIQLNHECAKKFYEEVEAYGFNIKKSDYWNVEISGKNAKEIIRNIKEKYKMSFIILAG